MRIENSNKKSLKRRLENESFKFNYSWCKGHGGVA